MAKSLEAVSGKTLLGDAVRKSIRETGYPTLNLTRKAGTPPVEAVLITADAITQGQIKRLGGDTGFVLTPAAPEYIGRRPFSKQEVIDDAFRKSAAAGEDATNLLVNEWKITQTELDTARVNSEKPSPQRKTRPSRR